MNTAAEMDRLKLAVGALLGLSEEEVTNAQLELADDYLNMLVGEAWLSNREDLALMKALPVFWTWWRQRWANRDRVILDKVPADLSAQWQASGLMLHEIYKAYHGPSAWGDLWPNDVVMEDFNTAKRDQWRAYRNLKNLFNHP